MHSINIGNDVQSIGGLNDNVYKARNFISQGMEKKIV
jgi:hypothetical protein